jgi:hypothetical protein
LETNDFDESVRILLLLVLFPDKFQDGLETNDFDESVSNNTMLREKFKDKLETNDFDESVRICWRSKVYANFSYRFVDVVS